MTRDLYSLNLLAKLMVLYRLILFSLTIAAIAEAILIRTSPEQLPSLHRVAPSYLKLVTFSNFWPLMLKSALMILFVLLVMISNKSSNQTANGSSDAPRFNRPKPVSAVVLTDCTVFFGENRIQSLETDHNTSIIQKAGGTTYSPLTIKQVCARKRFITQFSSRWYNYVPSRKPINSAVHPVTQMLPSLHCLLKEFYCWSEGQWPSIVHSR